MRYRVLPYKQGSASAAALAQALGGRVLKLEGSTFKAKAGDCVINWGSRLVPEVLFPAGSNFNYIGIEEASNKLTFFQKMAETCPDSIPQHWTSKEDIPDDAYPIVCRTILNGHSGAGIVVAESPEGLVDAPLYVKYEKKKDEYRVHYGKTPEGAIVISAQRKARRLSSDNPNWQVRNHQNGFVYVREGVQPPVSVLEHARRVFLSSGLDFGAVDVIYNEKKGRAFVLEINTAPGLEGQTVEDYANYFKEISNV